jgi:molybdopterin converting factor small subunit
MRVAIDCEYWDWDTPVGPASELAIIPPVSGG